MEEPRKLFTYDFIVLTLAATFGFCNIAIFYGFATYLERMGIDPAWRGTLIAAEPLAALCVRPFLSVWVTPGNALFITRLALAGMGAALLCYQHAGSIPGLLTVRVFHGLAFVCLVSAVMVMLTRVIPKQSSGRAFGFFSLSALVPYAVMPPLTEWLLGLVGSEAQAYAWASLLVLPALALFAPVGKRLGRSVASREKSGRPPLRDVLANLRSAPVALILMANLCITLCTTQVFYFMKPFALGLKLPDPGLFFTLSTGASIAVRLVAGPVYDRLPRHIVLLLALLVLAACLALYAGPHDTTRFYTLAAVYGCCLGVAMPLLNSAMFLHSAPQLRGTNLNLMLSMMDAGYVLGPMTGGALLAGGYGFPTLFMACAGFALTAGALVAPMALGELRNRER